MHRAAGHVDFSPLCVSGSLDFSVKLWNLKDSELLLSLERKHRHYVTDVQWSPVHPAVFISTDIDGMVSDTSMARHAFHDHQRARANPI